MQGQNLAVERRYAAGQNDRLPGFAAELVALKVDVLLTTTTPAALALKRATGSIPIIVAAVSDPVGTGLVASMNRPGGNVAALSSFASELSAKRLELLREIVPQFKRAAVVFNPESSASKLSFEELQDAAKKLGVRLEPVEVRRPDELEAGFEKIGRLHPDALIVLNEPPLLPLRTRIAEFAITQRLPSVYGYRLHADAGGLLTYAPDYGAIFERAATYVDKILKGAKPGDLPVEQPTKFELVINLKTAKALGLTIPPSLLGRADEVIQ
jgi:putative ABC transport system substrate-binding protein